MKNIIEVVNPTMFDWNTENVFKSDAVKVKLTKRQNEVLYDLQNGYILITDSSSADVSVAGDCCSYHISIAFFWKLFHMGFIYQGGINERHNYILTELGKKVITKPYKKQ